VTLVLGAVLGWFFGMLIATLFEVESRRRGERDALRSLARLEREVRRDERAAAAR
jgi:hypothetical protein